MSKVIRVATRSLGWNARLPGGFALGTLPGGGYGVLWHRGPEGSGAGCTGCPGGPRTARYASSSRAGSSSSAGTAPPRRTSREQGGRVSSSRWKGVECPASRGAVGGALRRRLRTGPAAAFPLARPGAAPAAARPARRVQPPRAGRADRRVGWRGVGHLAGGPILIRAARRVRPDPGAAWQTCGGKLVTGCGSISCKLAATVGTTLLGQARVASASTTSVCPVISCASQQLQFLLDPGEPFTLLIYLRCMSASRSTSSLRTAMPPLRHRA